MVEVVNTLKEERAARGARREDASPGGGGGGLRPRGPNEPLYQARRKIHPKAVSGTYRSLKTRLAMLFMAIYFILPWLRWDRGPGAPDQAVLVDLQNRRFYFFWIEIWPQEFYYVAGLLILAGVGLFIATSMVGRAWCGYACWQTVWTDLFMWVERKVEGDRNAQIRLEKAPWSGEKIFKRAAKFGIWILISFWTAFTFILYFGDAFDVTRWFFTGQAPFVAYSTVAIMGFVTYLFAGHMREQVCIYMCPWPRIQGAMVDEDTLIVTYHDWRGEPRGSKRDRKKHGEIQYGDCIDCGLCVAVCPTGIDIREGQQLACITCALCIDACNSVMRKIGRPQGLISYSNVKAYEALATGKSSQEDFGWRSFIRPRTIVYLTLWTLVAAGMMLHLATRDRLQINVVHDRNPIFVRLSTGEIRNGYTLRLLNMQLEPRTFRLSLEGLEGATMRIIGIDKPPARQFEIAVPGNKTRTLRVFVTTDPNRLRGRREEFHFRIEALGDDGKVMETARKKAVFEGPQR